MAMQWHTTLLAVLTVVALLTLQALPSESRQPEGLDKYGLLQSFDPSTCADPDISQECGLPKGRWLVITKQRSGSRWFVDTMTERTGGLVPYTTEVNCKGCSCGVRSTVPGAEEDQVCRCQLAHHFGKAISKKKDCGGTHHFGFKLMLPYGADKTKKGAFDVLARSVCKLGIPVIFMWRRNVLRRKISNASNSHDSRHPGGNINGTVLHIPHPVTEAEAASLRGFKPTIKTARLVEEIDLELKIQQSVEMSFRKLSKYCEVARNARTFYYEDVRDGAEHAAREWGEVFGSLKVWVPSELAIIHGNTPVLETVANPREVQDALEHTEHDWMLRD